MKKIEEYIKEQTLNDNPFDASHCDSYVELLEFNNNMIDLFYPSGDCPNDVLEKSKERNFDVVLEMLNSHNWEKLKNTLMKEFSDYILAVKKSENKSTSKYSNVAKILLICKDVKSEEKLRNDDKFKTILQFFNYFYSETKNMGYPVMHIEPTYAEKVNIHKEASHRNYGIAYHVTTKDNVKNILKKGLKCKQAKYRDYPSRIYLISPYEATTEETKKIIKKVIDDKWYGEGEYSILKVNLNRINDSFYTDVSTNRSKEVQYNGQAYIYTYQDIPSKYIEDITEEWEEGNLIKGTKEDLFVKDN